MRRLVLRIALWLGAVAVIVGVGVVLALAFGRPTVRVESSRTALVGDQGISRSAINRIRGDLSGRALRGY